MRRRLFLGGVGVAVAGAAIGVYGIRARATELSLYLSAFHRARGRGKLVLLANAGAVENAGEFLEMESAILRHRDRELALRLLLVDIQVTWNNDLVRWLTDDCPKIEPPWLVVIDGERPRLGKVMQLDAARFGQGLEAFLRDVVPLDVPWLEQRTALVWQYNPKLAFKIRRRIHEGSLTTDLARQAPVVVALEIARRTDSVRDQLMDVLVPRPPAPRRKQSDMIDCGLAMQLIDPLGRRFASEFTNGKHGRGRNHAAT